MRIAMMTNNYKPFIGGVPISIERLSIELRKLGHEVYIFAPSYDDEEVEEFVIRYHSLKRKLQKEYIIPDFLDPIIKDKFAELSFDLIHVHHPMMIGYSAQYLGKKYAIPVILTYHTRYEQYLHYLKPFERKIISNELAPKKKLRTIKNRLFDSGGEKLVSAHNRIFTNRCNLIFAPSQSMRDYLTEHGTITDIEVIPTGLLEEEFEYDAGKAEQLRSLYLVDKSLLFCTVSRLEKEKNIEFILESLKLFKDNKGDCFRLLIIGEGTRRQLLMERVISLGLERNVVFCGNIPHEELRNYYHASDLFLFASRSETQGIVLLEAMAAGLPTVAIEASGVRDVVVNAQNGYMTMPDIHSWTDRLLQLVEDKGLREEMCCNAITAAKHYLASNLARVVQKNYQNILYFRRMEPEYEYQNIYPVTSRIISCLPKNNYANRSYGIKKPGKA